MVTSKKNIGQLKKSVVPDKTKVLSKQPRKVVLGKPQSLQNTKRSKNVVVPKATPKSSFNTKLKMLNNPKGNQIGDYIDLGLDVLDTVVTTVENPVDGLLNKLPNAVTKFVDVATNLNKPLDPDVKDSYVSLKGPLVSGSKEEKFVDALKKDVPVVTITQQPSSYSADYSPAPLTVKDALWQGKTPCLRVNGSILVGNVVGNATGTLERLRAGVLNPGFTGLGSQLITLSQMHQRHMWLNVAMFYIPSCPTTTYGNIIFTYQNSPNITYLPTSDITELSQRSQFVMGHIHKGLTLPLKGDFRQLYNWFTAAPSDLKWYSDWSFEMWCMNLSSADGAVGYWGLTFDVLLFSRIEDFTIGFDEKYLRTQHFFQVSTGLSNIQLQKILGEFLTKFTKENVGEIACYSPHHYNSYAIENSILKLMDWTKLRMYHPYLRFAKAIGDYGVYRLRDMKLLEKLVDEIPLKTLLFGLLDSLNGDDDDIIDELDVSIDK